MTAARVSLALLAAAALACVTVEKVKVDPALGPPDEAVAPRAGRMRVAVVAPQPPPVPPGEPAPKRPAPTVVEFTAQYHEEYPSEAHMTSAVPAALREAGFELVPVRDAREARQSNAALVLELLTPEVEGFRNASAIGIVQEGAVMDVHVVYRARASTPSGHKLGVLAGHGESSAHFVFVDPHVETAVTGLVSLGLTAAATTLVGVPAAVAFVWIMNSPQDLLGVCREERLTQRIDAAERALSVANCKSMVNLLAQTALVGLVAAAASGTMTLSQFAATKVFGGVTGAIKGRVTGPQWQGMLKSAHDRAARSLAQAALDNVGRVQRLPAPGGSDG